jgi:hypothetical protein
MDNGLFASQATAALQTIDLPVCSDMISVVFSFDQFCCKM